MLTVHGFEIDENAIPATIIARLLTRQIAHILGNEVASSVLAKEKRAIAGEEGKLDSVTDAQLQAWRENPANVKAAEAWEQELRQAKVKAILDGTLSVRAPSSGRTVRDPIEAAMRRIAKVEIALVLGKQSPPVKLPTGEKTIRIGDVDVTTEELVERRLANAEHAFRIRRLAERVVADDKRLRDQSAKAVADGADELL